MEKRGAANLAATAPSPAKSARMKVRVWYVSEGGEVLAMDSGPLTEQGADKLRAECLRSSSDAVAVATVMPDGRLSVAGILPHPNRSATLAEVLAARVVSVGAESERMPDDDEATP